MDDVRQAPPKARNAGGERSAWKGWTEIQARARRGDATHTMARELGLDRQTVRRLLAPVRPATDPRLVPRPPRVAPSLDDRPRRVVAVDDHASRLVQARPRQGDPGGSEMVKRARDATGRGATPPGPHAPGDGGRGGVGLAGERQHVQVLVLRLGSSRALSPEVTAAARWPPRLSGHAQAVDGCGGVPHESRSEHPPTIVLGRDRTGRQRTGNPQCGDVTQDAGVQPRRCGPERARTPGQGASGVTSGHRAWLCGRSCRAWADLNAPGPDGGRPVADQRGHGTTVRKPAEGCLEAPRRAHAGRPRAGLQPRLRRPVARDCLVTGETTRSAVPAPSGGPAGEVPGGGRHDGAALASGHPAGHASAGRGAASARPRPRPLPGAADTTRGPPGGPGARRPDGLAGCRPRGRRAGTGGR